MRYKEICPPKTHPYVAYIAIDPIRFAQLQRMTEDAPELRFLDYDDSTPDVWTVRVGCASRAVKSALEDAWA